MAEKQGIPLKTIDGIPEAAVRRLAELWITTAEELVGAAAREDGRRGLAEHLGISQEGVGELVERAQATVPASVSFAAEDIERHGLGALDEPEDEEPPEQAPVAVAALPDQVDLRERLPPVRNQGSRGTCVAFACVAVREFLLGDGSAQGDLSEQFLYWDCKRRDLFSGPGTFVSTGMTCLESDGVCPEQVWPYNPQPIEDNEGQGPPPDDAAHKAADYQITDWQKLRSRWVHALREKLADGRPIAFAVPVYTYWFTAPPGGGGPPPQETAPSNRATPAFPTPTSSSTRMRRTLPASSRRTEMAALYSAGCAGFGNGCLDSGLQATSTDNRGDGVDE
jgi:hypothetical protein